MSQPLLDKSRLDSFDNDPEAGQDDSDYDEKFDQDIIENEKQPWYMRILIISIAIIIIAAIIVGVLLTIMSYGTKQPFDDKIKSNSKSTGINGNKVNVILMISDGFGPASEAFARSYHRGVKSDSSFTNVLPLDTILVGQSRTRSSNSLVTDSAAGATAFSCGIKTYNGAIGVDVKQNPCGTVLEAAKSAGYLTGLVVTSRITHATPASFSSHVINRDMENEIALQQIGKYPLGRQVDLMLGGGACHFLPKTITGSCRGDERDLFKEAKEDQSFKVIGDRIDFDNLNKHDHLPLLGLFTPDHMSYEIDRDSNVEPSLKEMASKALDILTSAAISNSSSSSSGFFLMIEGSRIDMAGHSNDAATHLRDILAYQDTVELVKKYVDLHPNNTVMISVADHETGGLTLARQLSPDYPEYLWYPLALTNVTHSSAYLAELITKYAKSHTKTHVPDLEPFVKETIFAKGLGIYDATKDELQAILKHSSQGSTIDYILADMVSRRAQLGWTTHGHSGVDVNLYAHGYRSQELIGSHENTDIGTFISKVMGLNLTTITNHLTSNISGFGDWHKPTTMQDLLQYTDSLKHYHAHHEGEPGTVKLGNLGGPGGSYIGGVNTHLRR